jgi:hypothetical protein
MAQFTYPTNAEIMAIAQDKMPRLTADRPVFDFFPIRTLDAAFLIWEQLDNFRGLQQIRGLNGSPPKVQPVGLKQYVYTPGFYGEYIDINEQEITERRAPGTFGQPINISDLVLERQDQLLQRRLDRIEFILWTLLATGTFSVPAAPSITGGSPVVHTDSFPLQTFTAAVTWANFSASTPLADFSAVQLLHRGHSVDFGAVAKAYMNRGTFNNLRSNVNGSDIYGRRTAGLGTFNNLQGINQLLTGDDLPEIYVYDDGYFTETGQFVTFIPNNTVIVVGERPAGQVVGEYRMVRNANNADVAAGPYMKVVDWGEMKVPRLVEIHDGHNGGPIIYYPSAIAIMNV